MLPITLRDMRTCEDELLYLLSKSPKSYRLKSRLRNLQIKMAKKSIICAKFYSTPSNIRTEWK